MSVFDKLLSKWKHADPVVRAKAVSQLTDQALLAAIAEDDVNEDVRIAAVQRLTDQPALGRIARGNGSLATHAIRALTDPVILIEVAGQAELARVRELAVEKIDDKAALQRIAACDVDAWVRLQAKMKSAGSDRVQDVIRESLAKLQVAELRAAEVAEFCGSLDDVCGALVKDRRFRINGGMDDPRETMAAMSESASSTNGATVASSSPTSSYATFLAGRRSETGEPEERAAQTVFYEISIWRGEQDTFQGRVKERRVEVTHDVAAWKRSTREDGQ